MYKISERYFVLVVCLAGLDALKKRARYHFDRFRFNGMNSGHENERF